MRERDIMQVRKYYLTLCVCESVFSSECPAWCVWDNNVHKRQCAYLCEFSRALVRCDACACACACAWASRTVHTNYISECVSGRNGHCRVSSSEESFA